MSTQFPLGIIANPPPAPMSQVEDKSPLVHGYVPNMHTVLMTPLTCSPAGEKASASDVSGEAALPLRTLIKLCVRASASLAIQKQMERRNGES